jgi:hypothetical protein
MYIYLTLVHVQSMKPIEVARMVHALFTKFDEAVKVERGREGDEREGEGGREGGRKGGRRAE